MSILKLKDENGNWNSIPTLKGDTGNGIESTVLNSDYTLTINYTDGTDYTTPSIRGEKGSTGSTGAKGDKGDKGDQGVQGERGLTGATPNLTIGTVDTLTPNDDATVNITGTPENPVLNLGIPQGNAGEVTLDEFYKAFPTDTASGAIASFSDGADDLPLKSLVVDINPVQDLHGQENPYPAGGGANKFDGIMVADGSYLLSANYIPVTEGQTWYIYAPNFPANDYCYGKFYDSNFSEIDAGTPHFIGRNTTYTIPSGVAYIKLRYWGTFDASNMAFNYPATVTTYSPYENLCPISGWTEVDVEQSGKNLLNSNYSAYQANSNYLYINGVVPEGQTARFTLIDKDTSVDVSGINIGFQNGLSQSVLTPTKYRWAINAGNIQSNMSNVQGGVICSGVFIYPNTKAAFDLLFSRWNIMVELGSTATPYEPYTGRSITINLGQTVYGGKLDVLSGELTVYPYYASYNGETLTGEWISDRDKYVSGATPTIGAQVVNIGAEGTEIQLEPHEVESLYGVNNLWADSGDTEVEYRADTELFIEKVTPEVSVDDVQINGTSIVENGVANVPIANADRLGVIKASSSYGLYIATNGLVSIQKATDADAKAGTTPYRPIMPSNQHMSAFYGLAKAAGDTSQASSSNAVGTYTENAISKINDMLNAPVSVSGTTPTITAKSGVQYICGEVATLNFAPSATGICDVIFTSGSTPTVLTLPSTVKFPDGEFTPEANKTYEINILNGVYGAVMAWT